MPFAPDPFFSADPANSMILIDRKISATTKSKQVADMQRVAEALRQNEDYKLIIEVPTEAAKRQVQSLIRKANIPNGKQISVEIP